MQKSYSPVLLGGACLLALLVTAGAGAADVEGTVKDASTGTPLGGMVAAAYTSAGSLQATATTASNGKYSLNVPPGRYRLLAYDPNGAYATTFGSDADSFDSSPSVSVTSDIGSMDFALRRGGQVSGTVLQSGTQLPLRGMTVAAYNIATGTRRGFTQTAADGTFSLVLPQGEYKVAAFDPAGVFAVAFFASQMTFASAATVTVTAGQGTAGVNFQLTPAAHFNGSVVDADTNQPIAGAFVTAYTSDGSLMVVSTATDASGSYSLAVPPGSYKVVAADTAGIYATGYLADANSFANELALAVDAAQTVGQVVIPLHRAGGIAGRVTDSSKTPLAGITVAAYNDDGTQRTTAQTNANGAYVLLVPSGTFRVAAYDNALTFATMFYPDQNVFSDAPAVSVSAGQTSGADFSLVRGARFSGTVTDRDSGAVVGSISVAAYDGDGNLLSSATSDASGHYALVVPPGDYKLAAFDNLLRYITAYGGGAQNYDSAAIFKVDGDSSGHVDFALAQGVRVSGTVIDSGAALVAVSGVQIAALDTGGDRVATATAHDGTFDLVLAPGTYKLLAVDPLGRFYAMFYSNAWTLGTATPIVVQIGGVSNPISLTLLRHSRRHAARH